MGKLRYLADVVTLRLDQDTCTGCGMCETVCPRGVLAVSGGKADVVDRDACIECGACALNCPVDAIEVRAGVGCACAVVRGLLTGKGDDCGCGSCCGT